MSSLEKKISNFKKELNERNVFTEDDITELESHILDKVDDLKQSGLSEDDAFNETLSDLGPIDEIAAEYSKVNLSSINKCMLFCLGYISINFFISLIWNITKFITCHPHNSGHTINITYIPILSPLLDHFLGYEYSYILIFISLLNIVSICVLLYFLLNKKHNLLLLISNKILSIKSSSYTKKLPISFIILAMPVSSIILNIITQENGFTEMTVEALYVNDNLDYILINIVLLFAFIIKYVKNKSINDASFYMILGYLLITMADRYIPRIIMSICFHQNSFNSVTIVLLFILLVILMSYCITKIINNRLLEKHPNFILPSILVVLLAGYTLIFPINTYFFLSYTPYAKFYTIFSVLSGIMQLCLSSFIIISIFIEPKTINFGKTTKLS